MPQLPPFDKGKIAVLGLGYVGLPLAVAFGKQRAVIGFDADPRRVAGLQKGVDSNKEVASADLLAAKHVQYTATATDLAAAQIFIITVPTPLDNHNRPDLSHLLAATRLVGEVLKPASVVIYESTVFPGCTEEICAPLLAKQSGLTYNRDFFCGYSPERINPGDINHRLETITKVTSGSTPEAADFIDRLYASIITAGTYQAASIAIAEAAKVIENTQRDINIALINELAIIFNRLDIDTEAVLQAAETKWNFLSFRPGLVGGHCISVDPYYLTHKARELGYSPEVILAGRRLNDSMAHYVATRLVKAMLQAGVATSEARVLILGLAFKENCADVRNSQVFKIIAELAEYNIQTEVYDPRIEAATAKAASSMPINLVKSLAKGRYDAMLLAVAHDEIVALGAAAIRQLGRKNHVFYDVKHAFAAADSDLRL